MKENIFEIVDWNFTGIQGVEDAFMVYFKVKGEAGPLGARGLIMDKLRGIEGKHFVKKEIWS